VETNRWPGTSPALSEVPGTCLDLYCNLARLYCSQSPSWQIRIGKGAIDFNNGDYRDRGEYWQQKREKGWRNIGFNSTRQALWHCRRLQAYLAESGIQATVKPRVVWAGEGFIRIPSARRTTHRALAMV
jgi:hypothetical protein